MQHEALPAQARQALTEGRKIEAIRIVREVSGLGLKEAKERVEAAMAADPALRTRAVHRQRVSPGTLLAIACLAVIAWVLLKD